MEFSTGVFYVHVGEGKDDQKHMAFTFNIRQSTLATSCMASSQYKCLTSYSHNANKTHMQNDTSL